MLARLRSIAKEQSLPANELDQHYVMERVLYRLSQSQYRKEFVLKGAVMLRSLELPASRPTRDIDLLGLGSNEEEVIKSAFRKILALDYPEDGVVIDIDSISLERIVEDADYPGLRLRFTALIGTARYVQYIDIGFGDRVHPDPVMRTLPAILNQAPPELLCYSIESVIAEKLQAMLHLGDTNSRIKDYYDIWWLSSKQRFSGEQLAHAISETLKQRQTAADPQSTAFSRDFISMRAARWMALRERLDDPDAPLEFAEVVQLVQGFVRPLLEALKSGSGFSLHWDPPGPWR
ncbi:nucleotidyl transferase AbiEii/AbiGii toxin family protein [bacterium]|nr:nucleotidyl transferase AbiEii/AbiGii toxin family protein [bacterium]